MMTAEMKQTVSQCVDELFTHKKATSRPATKILKKHWIQAITSFKVLEEKSFFRQKD